MNPSKPNQLSLFEAAIAASAANQPGAQAAGRKLVRRKPSMMALEQRFMFDGAAVGDVVSEACKTVLDATHTDAVVKAADKTVHLDIVAPAGVAVSSTVLAAKAEAEKLVADFLARPDAKEQLFALFNGGQTQPSAQWLAAFDQLMADVQSGTDQIRVELRSDAEMSGAYGAFSISGTTGGATIYLNGDRLAGQSTATIVSVMVEEIGHSLDARLSVANDTAGDEGQRFAYQLATQTTPDASFGVDNDHTQLTIDGQDVQVELAVAPPLPDDLGWQNLVPKGDPNGGSQGIDGSWTANAPDLVGDTTTPYLQYMFTNSNATFNLKLRVEPRSTDPVGIPDAHFLFDMNRDGIPDFTILLQSTKTNTAPTINGTTGLNSADSYTYQLWILPLAKGTSADSNTTPSSTTIAYSSSTSFLIYDSQAALHSEGTGSGTTNSITRVAGNTYNAAVNLYSPLTNTNVDGDSLNEKYYVVNFDLTAYTSFLNSINRANYETLQNTFQTSGQLYGAGGSATQANAVNGDIGGGPFTGADTWKYIFGINDIPTAINNTYTATEDTLLTGKNIITNDDNGATTGGLDTDTETANAALTIGKVNGTTFTANGTDADHLAANGWMQVTLTNGTLYIKQDGTMEYKPSPNSTATDTFTYTIKDTGIDGLNVEESNPATVTLNVTPVNDAPTISLAASSAMVYESGLATGSSPSTSTRSYTSTFTVSDVDGLPDVASISFLGSNGTTVLGTLTTSSGGLSGLVGQIVNLASGSITLTGYSNGTFTYRYTLSTRVTDVANATEYETFTIKVTDSAAASATALMNVEIVDDLPVITSGSVAAIDTLTVDETTLGTNVAANFADNFAGAIHYGADGVGNTAYALVLTGSNVDSGLYTLGVNGARGNQIVLNQSGNTITGSYNSTNYFTISINTGTGVVTLDQLAAIYHADGSNADDASTLNTAAGALKLRATATDADGDAVSHDIDIGAGAGSAFKFKDDAPDAVATSTATVALPALQLDETTPLVSGLRSVTSATSFAANFDSNTGTAGVQTQYGADGAGTVSYALSLSAEGIDSGLYALDASDTTATEASNPDGIGQGAAIKLYTVNGVIYGKTGVTTDASAQGITYFSISINNTAGADFGKVTFSQNANIWHASAGNNPDDVSTLRLGAGAYMRLTQTVTDADGDADSAYQDLANGSAGTSVFSIKDDGPNAANNTAGVTGAQTTPIALIVDETAGTQTGADATTAGTTTADFTGLFQTVTSTVDDAGDYGTDGAGSVGYGLSLVNASSGAAVTGLGSGMYALDSADVETAIDPLGKGAEILLKMGSGATAGMVIGYVTVSGTDVEYFRISTASTGVVTFTQAAGKNLWHSATNDANDGATLALSQLSSVDVALRLTQTVTDADGDTATASVDLVSSDTATDVATFTVRDDGPVPVADTDSITEGSTTAATGNVLTGGTDSGDSNSTDGNADGRGTDGAVVSGVQVGNIAATTQTTAGNLGQAIDGSYGILTLNSDGRYSYRLFTQADVTSVSGRSTGYNAVLALGPTSTALNDVFSYTLTDGDGDIATTTLTLAIAGINSAPVANADNADGSQSATAEACTLAGHVAATSQTGNVLLGTGDPEGKDTDPEVATIIGGSTHEVTAVTSETGATWNGTSVVGRYGRLAIAADGTYTYTLFTETEAANDATAGTPIKNGYNEVKALNSIEKINEYFTYTMSEKGGTNNLSASSTIRIVIEGRNDAPVAVNDFGYVQFINNDTARGNLVQNDKDVDQNTLYVDLITKPGTTYGTVSYDGNGLTSVDGDAVAAGYLYIFRYTSSSASTALTSTTDTPFVLSGTTMTIAGNNASMVFTMNTSDDIEAYKASNALGPNQSYYIQFTTSGNPSKDGVVEIGVPTGGSSSIVPTINAIQGQYGTLSVLANGEYTYTLTVNPGSGLYHDKFNYRVTDLNCTDTAVLDITISGIANLTDTTVNTNEDAPRTAALVDTSWGDYLGARNNIASFIIQGDAGTYTPGTAIVPIAGVGSLVLEASGTYTFTPLTDYHGAVPTITYTLRDGAKAALNIIVDPVNDAPDGADKTINLTDKQTYTLNVNDFGFTDPNDTPDDLFNSVVFTTVPDPLKGTLKCNVGGATLTTVTAGMEVLVSDILLGRLTYTPIENLASPISSFDFQVRDDGGTARGGINLDPASDPVNDITSANKDTITFNVTPVNDAPTISASVGGSVNESDLSVGTSPSLTGPTSTGTFTVGDPDGLGNISRITFTETGPAGTTLTFTVGTGALSDLVNQTFTTTNGTVKITVYDPNSGEFGYEFTLTTPTTDATGTETNSFKVTVIDGTLSANTTVTISIVDDVPAIALQTTPVTGSLVVDESALPGAGDGVRSATLSVASNFSNGITGNSPYTGAAGGADGATVSSAYRLDVNLGGQTSVASGLVDSVTNEAVNLSMNGAVVEGRTATGNFLVFTLSVNDASGLVTLTQLRAVQHDNPADHDESGAPSVLNTVTNGLVRVVRTDTITDADGDIATDEEGLDISSALKFEDDGPSINGASVAAIAIDTLTVDESDLTTSATANFADNFASAINYGADGAGSVSYALNLSAPGVGSGLYALDPSDTTATEALNPDGIGQGAEIKLYTNAGVIEGRTGSSSGTLYFTISIDASTGVVTLDQVAAIYHGSTASNDDTATLHAVANDLVLRATVTDADGDQVTHDLDVGSGGAFKIKDDGPSITVSTVGLADALIVDDSTLGTPATASFADNFGNSVAAGADGANVATSYTLSAVAGNSGLVDTLTQQAVVLSLNVASATVEGRTATSNELVFTLSVDNNSASPNFGRVTLTQSRSVVHNDNSDADEAGTSAATLSAANLVRLTRTDTITDGDGDSTFDSKYLNLGSSLQFKDDGPSITAPSANAGGAVSVDETSQLTVAVTGGASLFTGGVVTVGADGGTTDVKFVIEDPASGLRTIGGKSISLVADGTNNNIVYGKYDNTGTLDATAFTLSVSDAGVLTVTQAVALQHPIGGASSPNEAVTLAGKLSLAITTTDGDGDSATRSMDAGGAVSFLDDGPTPALASSPATVSITLDESVLRSDTKSFAGYFSNAASIYGNDGAGTVNYALRLSAEGIASGLFALDYTDTVTSDSDGIGQGDSILLYTNANTGAIEGRTGSATGTLYFTLNVNAAGSVTFDQSTNVWHPWAGGVPSNVSLAPTGGTLQLAETVTDADGDTSSIAMTLGAGNFAIASHPLDITVTGGTYNEKSPRAIFTVNANLGQNLTLDVVDAADTGKNATGDNEGGGADELDNTNIYYSIDGGANWVRYTGAAFVAGNVPVQVAVDITPERDGTYEGEEQLKLVVNSGLSTQAQGYSSIMDDGTGKITDPIDENTHTPGTPSEGPGPGFDDDRPITVQGGSYNEKSGRALFTVDANPNQWLTLNVVDEASAGKAATGDNEGKPDDSLDEAPIYYSIDGGATWNLYTGPFQSGTLNVLVAVDVTNEADDVYEGEEQFKLIVNEGKTTESSGYSSLFDDGSGKKWTVDPLDPAKPGVESGPGPAAGFDDDRPVEVSSPTVNEASPYAVFTVSGSPDQLVTLVLTDGTATGADYGPELEISVDGITWTPYTGGVVALNGSGKLLVRTSIVNDSEDEGDHTFTLTATNTSGMPAEGVATINDHGEGDIFKDDGSTDPDAIKDDDRPKPAPIPPVISEPEAPPKPIIPEGEFVPPPPAKFYVPEPVPVKEVLTSSSGFRAAVIEGSAPALTLFKGIDDQFVESVGNVTSFALPSDAFAHTRAEAALTLEAKMADGTNLPAWVAFDGQAGVFRLTPPAGFAGELEIKVIARDNEGREAEAKFKLNVAPKVQKVGRESLSEKLKLAGRMGNQWLPSHELRTERAERMAPHRVGVAERVVVKAKA